MLGRPYKDERERTERKAERRKHSDQFWISRGVKGKGRGASNEPMEVPLSNHSSNRHSSNPTEDSPHPDPQTDDEKDQRRGFGFEVVDPGPFRSEGNERTNEK